MLFVVWAASYGVDHRGNEDPWDGPQGIQYRKQRTNAMMQELLYLIDIHGILRKPSWDGVRVLLLAMPLTEGASFNIASSLSPDPISRGSRSS